ncbi:MAG TPA: hypothetical protein VMU09_09785 [Acidimicrobiales bacterium]|nr:hypothetical protein [Acidimicrobiales bacterium]
MTLGERCDEIMRLIDETLTDVATDRTAADPYAAATLPSRWRSAARTAAAARPERLPAA